jgi:hypothetical protein
MSENRYAQLYNDTLPYILNLHQQPDQMKMTWKKSKIVETYYKDSHGTIMIKYDYDSGETYSPTTTKILKVYDFITPYRQSDFRIYLNALHTVDPVKRPLMKNQLHKECSKMITSYDFAYYRINLMEIETRRFDMHGCYIIQQEVPITYELTLQITDINYIRTLANAAQQQQQIKPLLSLIKTIIDNMKVLAKHTKIKLNKTK